MKFLRQLGQITELAMGALAVLVFVGLISALYFLSLIPLLILNFLMAIICEFIPVNFFIINKAPGYNLAKLTEFLYSKRTYKEVFEPILSDLQLEYQEALAAKRWNKARWIAICGRGHFVAAALARLPISLTRMIVTLWKLGGS